MITNEMVEAGVNEIRKAKHTCFDRWTDHEAIRAVLTAAFAAVPVPAVTVKPMEWREAPGQMAHTSEPFPYFKYVIVDDARGVDWSIGGDGWNPVENVEAAKAAAQADYEARILSALTPAPDLASENEMLRAALEKNVADNNRLTENNNKLEMERVRLWSENRDIRASIDVEKAATDSMRIERDTMQMALRSIAAPHDCGCKPSCQCNTQESLEIEVEALRDIAKAALSQDFGGRSMAIAVHPYSPDKDNPQFCGVCGYASHEILMHPPTPEQSERAALERT